ncbi:MAG: alpha-2-macroglobulin family protein, partial [Planctomycetota bacterium]
SPSEEDRPARRGRSGELRDDEDEWGEEREEADTRGDLGRSLKKLKRRIRREYAHKPRPGRRPEDRTDFTETVYWNAGLQTDAEGKGEVTFHLSDAVTSFRVRADAFSAAGALGKGDALVVSRKPFFIEPKLPLEITAGDLVDVPVALFNGTGEVLKATLTATLGPGLVMEGAEPKIDLQGGSSGRLYLTLIGGKHNGPVAVTLSGKGGEFADRIVRNLPVVPYGFPVGEAYGGKLAGTAKWEIRIPNSVVADSVEARAAVYTSPLATLTDALKGLIREPHGCFEQTSSTTYPNIMVMQYLETHPLSEPEVAARCRVLLDRGYKRLVGFECKQKGYEWFGRDPGSEGLTAYGVMEFTDMARVYPVNGDMLERTRRWLKDRRDGKGGFERNPNAPDHLSHAPRPITNAYIVWALLESGEKGLEKEVEAIKGQAAGTNDPYFLALSANILLLAGKDATGILEKIAAKQDAGGAVRGAKTSITCSGGNALVIETTALAVLAWLKSGGYIAQVEKAANWLFKQCQGGRFGSTQSTILALKAILGYDASRGRPKAAGKVTLLVDGKAVRTLAFDPATTGTLDFTGFADRLIPGTHTIELKMVEGSEMPFAVEVRYKAATPVNHPDCKVALSTSLSGGEVGEGETLEARVRLQSLADESLPMTLAIIGLPGGLEPRHDQLKELVKQKQVDFYEVRGREVILYWCALPPRALKETTLSLTAAVPGLYTGPASRAYLYYTDEQKMWCPGMKIKVKRAGE